MNRWVTYQRERFPLAGHAPLVAAFSASAVCFSTLMRGHIALPPPSTFLVAFVTSLLFFLQLRIADEFKDYEDDARYRPYRPVPRGLVSLRELAWVGAGAAAIQLALGLALTPSIVWLLAIAWLYLALMTREFFVPRWLKQHPIAYMASHMLILPLVDLYATACDWWVAGLRWPPSGLFLFLVVSYLNGLVIEIGRKTRVPADEEPGVETYSALWGTSGAIRAWLSAVLITAFAAWRASVRTQTDGPMLALLVVLVGACSAVALRVLRRRAPGSGKSIELMSGTWTIFMYLGLGAAPLAYALLRQWWVRP
jgi:4-hydroxybenzoate polyprenyltransferase